MNNQHRVFRYDPDSGRSTPIIPIVIARKPEPPISEEAPTNCPQCGSAAITFDEGEGFYKCGQCTNVWALDRDDPDYQELDDLPY